MDSSADKLHNLLYIAEIDDLRDHQPNENLPYPTPISTGWGHLAL
ncbi:hypothetical protein J3D54_004495 [Pseudomonas sp. GGS8]|nr:hypothetical protein [Pseudomonas sp. GGS8]